MVNFKGKNNPFYGKKHSKEAIEKMRLAKLGKRGKDTNRWDGGMPHCLDCSKQLSTRTAVRCVKCTGTLNSGVNSRLWKGGKTAEENLERTRFRMNVQKRVFRRDNYTCQVCDQHGGYLQVDHMKSWAKFPELRFEESNCRTLCMACHYYVTFKRKLPKGIIWGHNFSRRIAS